MDNSKTVVCIVFLFYGILGFMFLLYALIANCHLRTSASHFEKMIEKRFQIEADMNRKLFKMMIELEQLKIQKEHKDE